MTLFEMTKGRVKDDSGKLSEPFDYDDSIAAAIKRYSKDRPRLTCFDQPGQDSSDIPLPADWNPGFSAIESIEYPIGNNPETLVDSRDWRLYRTPTDTFIRFETIKPASSKDVRLLYSILHDEASLPVSDLEAVANLAASYCCRVLANAFGNTSDPVIQADVVNYRSKGDEYARRAKELEGLYKNHLGIRDGDTVAAATASVSAPDAPRVRLTHGRNR